MEYDNKATLSSFHPKKTKTLQKLCNTAYAFHILLVSFTYCLSRIACRFEYVKQYTSEIKPSYILHQHFYYSDGYHDNQIIYFLPALIETDLILQKVTKAKIFIKGITNKGTNFLLMSENSRKGDERQYII